MAKGYANLGMFRWRSFPGGLGGCQAQDWDGAEMPLSLSARESASADRDAHGAHHAGNQIESRIAGGSGYGLEAGI